MSASSAIIVMGVSGSGKTSVGMNLASRLGGVFVDADALHPASNVAKMTAGIALDDDDRWPWLDRVVRAFDGRADLGSPTVIACSALRRIYRDRLRAGVRDLVFVHLDGPRDVILARMDRPGHFMPSSLLDSQLSTLEPLEPDEAGIVIDVRDDLDAIVGVAVAAVAP